MIPLIDSQLPFALRSRSNCGVGHNQFETESPLIKGRCCLIGCQGGVRPIASCHSVSKRPGPGVFGHRLVAGSFNGVASEIRELPGAASSPRPHISAGKNILQSSNVKSTAIQQTTNQQSQPFLTVHLGPFETIHIIYGVG